MEKRMCNVKKGKVVPVRAVNAYGGSGYIAPLSQPWHWMVVTGEPCALATLPQGKSPQYP